MMQTWLPIQYAPAASLPPLDGAEVERLRAAGAGVNEFTALACAQSEHDRAALLNFFAFICPENYRRLRAVVRLVRCWRDRGHPLLCGADQIYNGARVQFRRFGHGGSNDERCFITRAVAIVAPELRQRGMLDMKSGGHADILLNVRWYPSGQIEWGSLPPLDGAELAACRMPL